jgi:hypothetical protein
MRKAVGNVAEWFCRVADEKLLGVGSSCLEKKSINRLENREFVMLDFCRNFEEI